MVDPAIDVVGVSKRYRLGASPAHHGSLREAIVAAVGRLLGPARSIPGADGEEFWALRDVTFAVEPGDVVGIVGRNGAGKSTMLKVLSRITQPTAGRVVTRGRVASLLEVGTGFHPELSGRENIFLNGAILRMTRSEIERKFEDIVAFAEVERFLDTPLKRYSSGMYVRLAFAVAAFLEPEILLVDEVLAVGDAEFQRKCIGKMGQVASEGRTVVFVSHNMSAVRALCRKGVLLEGGRLVASGTIEDVVSRYLRAGGESLLPRYESTERPGAGAQILRVEVVGEAGELASHYPYDSKLQVRIDVVVRDFVGVAYLALHVHDDELQSLVFSRQFLSEDGTEDVASGRHAYTATLPASLLVPGQYSVSVHLMRLSPATRLDGVDHRCSFELVDRTSVNARLGLPWRGVIATPLDWQRQEPSRLAEGG